MIGILLASYGTPTSIEQLPDYLTSICHAHPTDEQVAVVQARYDAIEHWAQGGRTQWMDTLQQQLRTRLAMPVAVGYQHVQPSLEEAVAQLEAQGVDTIFLMVTTPFSAPLSTDTYVARAKKACVTAHVVPILHWSMEPSWLTYWVAQVRTIERTQQQTALVLTAHSLPMVGEASQYEPYVSQYKHMADMLRFHTDMPVCTAYQSQGPRGTWLGPDVMEVTGHLLAEGYNHIVVAPVGFVNDHVEVLYDLDIALQQHIASLGGMYTRLALPGEQIALPMAEAIATVQEG